VLLCVSQEVHKLVNLPDLEELVMYGNPIHSKIVEDGDLQWPIAILKVLPNLKKLDGISSIEWKVHAFGSDNWLARDDRSILRSLCGVSTGALETI
jgi:hypothetical protein